MTLSPLMFHHDVQKVKAFPHLTVMTLSHPQISNNSVILRDGQRWPGACHLTARDWGWGNKRKKSMGDFNVNLAFSHSRNRSGFPQLLPTFSGPSPVGLAGSC